MESPVDSRQRNFLSILGYGGPLVHRTRRCRACHLQWIRPGSELGFQHGSRGTRVDAVRAGIFWMKWGVDQWLPAGVTDGSFIAVYIPVANCGYRAPEIESVSPWDY